MSNTRLIQRYISKGYVNLQWQLLLNALSVQKLTQNIIFWNFNNCFINCGIKGKFSQNIKAKIRAYVLSVITLLPWLFPNLPVLYSYSGTKSARMSVFSENNKLFTRIQEFNEFVTVYCLPHLRKFHVGWLPPKLSAVGWILLNFASTLQSSISVEILFYIRSETNWRNR